MPRLTVDELVEWTESEIGGMIVDFTPETLQTAMYFLREFAVPTADPLDHLEAFRTGHLLIVGKRRFCEDLTKGLRPLGDRHGMDF